MIYRALVAASLLGCLTGTQGFCDEVNETTTTPTPTQLIEGYSKHIFRVGASYRHFDYLELDGANDGEIGSFPGLSLGYEFRPGESDWYVSTSFEGTSTKTRYNGSDLDHKIFIQKDTPTQLLEVEANLGVKIAESISGSALKGYTGIGYHYWRRGDAGVTKGVHSYREDYTWWILPVGLKWEQYITEKFRVTLDVSGRLTFGGNTKGYLSQVADLQDVNAKLTGTLGYRAQLPLIYQTSPTLAFVVSPGYEYSTLGRSKPFGVFTKDGQQILNRDGEAFLLLEPSSRTSQFGTTAGVAITL